MLFFQLFSTSDGLFSSKYSSDNITPMHPCHNFLHHHITKTPLDPDPGIKTPPEASLNTCHKSQNIFLLFSSELDDSSGQDTAEIRGNMTDTALLINWQEQYKQRIKWSVSLSSSLITIIEGRVENWPGENWPSTILISEGQEIGICVSWVLKSIDIDTSNCHGAVSCSGPGRCLLFANNWSFPS